MNRYVILVAVLAATFGLFANAQAEISEVGSLDIEWNYFGDVAIVRLTAFATSFNGGLYLVDVSQPADPRLMERIAGPCSGVEAEGDYAFVGFNRPEGLRVFLVDSLVYSGEPANVRGLLLEDGLLYLTTKVDSTNILKIFNVANPAEPSLLGQLEIGYWGEPSVLIGGRLYVEGSADGEISTVSIIDVSDPEDPELIRQIEEHQGNIVGIATDGEYLFVANQMGGHEGVQVRDFDWQFISETWVYLPQGLAFYEGHLFVASSIFRQGPTFRIFDVSDPEELRVVEEYSTGRQAMKLWFDGELCYLVEDGVDEEHPSRLAVLYVEIREPEHWIIEPTDSAHVFYLSGDLSDGEVAVAANQGGWYIIVGASVWLDDSTIVESWPDDPDTEELEGFSNDQQFHILGFDQAVGLEYEIDHQEISAGDRLLVKNGHTTISSLAFDEPRRWLIKNPEHWPDERTGESNHSFIIMSDSLRAQGALNNFDEIAILTSGDYVAGSCVYHELFDRREGRRWVGLAAWPDDPQTEEVDGFREGENFHFKVWDHQADEEFNIDYEIRNNGPDFWQDWATTRVMLILPEEESVQRRLATPLEFRFHYPFPNPFNFSTRIAFALPQTGRATLAVYDLSGREAVRLIDGSVPAGAHSVIFDAQGLATGSYFLRLESQQGVRTQKLMFVK